jgi:hypothetical protein
MSFERWSKGFMQIKNNSECGECVIFIVLSKNLQRGSKWKQKERKVGADLL